MTKNDDAVQYDANDLRTIAEPELMDRAKDVIRKVLRPYVAQGIYPNPSEFLILVVEKFRTEPVHAKRLARLTLWWLDAVAYRGMEPEQIVCNADDMTNIILSSPPYLVRIVKDLPRRQMDNGTQNR